MQPTEVVPVDSLTTPLSIAPEVEKRLGKCKSLITEIYALAQQEAQAHGLTLCKVDIRPVWSHEYAEHAGIVIDAAVQAMATARFAYWDAMSERLQQLADSLPPEEQHFLREEIAFMLSRG